MKIKKTGRKQLERKIVEMEKYGNSWDLERLKSTLDYFSSGFVLKYLNKI